MKSTHKTVGRAQNTGAFTRKPDVKKNVVSRKAPYYLGIYQARLLYANGRCLKVENEEFL